MSAAPQRHGHDHCPARQVPRKRSSAWSTDDPTAGVLSTPYEWHPRREVCALDPARKVATARDGGELPYDLFLAVPVHQAPAVVSESGLTVDGWIPVDPLTLETTFPGVFAIGDVAAVGTPRAGVFAEGHAAIAAEHISALVRGTTSDARYGGRGVCYIEFGDKQIAKVDVTFFGDQKRANL
jgi:sulfide:quinone oxidoreductase